MCVFKKICMHVLEYVSKSACVHTLYGIKAQCLERAYMCVFVSVCYEKVTMERGNICLFSLHSGGAKG